jgi:hypothetical protein
MALTLNKTGITTGNTVEAYHVTQSIDAFAGTVAYNINLSGSFAVTGSLTNGANNRATGLYSHAEGTGSLASGVASYAGGLKTTASGDYSFAGGFQSKAIGQSSIAFGVTNQSIGQASFALGYNAYAGANNSLALGTNVSTSGDYSIAAGDGTNVIGVTSFAFGKNLISSGSIIGSSQFIIGRNNTQGDNTSLFIIGNGITTGTRKDAFKVNISGSIVLPTTQSVSPTWTGTDGEIIPATVGGVHLLYMWMAGAWRSSSFA